MMDMKWYFIILLFFAALFDGFVILDMKQRIIVLENAAIARTQQ